MERGAAVSEHRPSAVGTSAHRLRSCVGSPCIAPSAVLKRTTGTVERSRRSVSSDDSFPPSFDAFTGGRHYLRRATQIPIRLAHIHVSEIGGQHRHAAAYLLTAPIPAKKRLDGKAM